MFLNGEKFIFSWRSFVFDIMNIYWFYFLLLKISSHLLLLLLLFFFNQTSDECFHPILSYYTYHLMKISTIFQINFLSCYVISLSSAQTNFMMIQMMDQTVRAGEPQFKQDQQLQMQSQNLDVWYSTFLNSKSLYFTLLATESDYCANVSAKYVYLFSIRRAERGIWQDL